MGDLWVNEYVPRRLEDLAGNQELAQKVVTWLANWRYGASRPLLMCGPPGCGKTTTAWLAANVCGREVVELNASDTRNQSALRPYMDEFAAYADSNLHPKPLVFNRSTTAVVQRVHKLLLFEEVDGIDGASDRGGVKLMVEIAKRCILPVIFTANLEARAPKMAPILRLCGENVLTFRPITERQMTAHINRIAYLATGRVPEAAFVANLVQACRGDLRRLINETQFRLAQMPRSHEPRRPLSVLMPIVSIASAKEVVAAHDNPFERARALLLAERTSLDQRMEEASENRYLTQCFIFANYPEQQLPRAFVRHMSRISDMFSIADQIEKAVDVHHMHALEQNSILLGTVMPAWACGVECVKDPSLANPRVNFPSEVLSGNSKWLAAGRTVGTLSRAFALKTRFSRLDAQTCRLLYRRIHQLLEHDKKSEALLTIVEPYGIHPDLWPRFVSLATWGTMAEGPARRTVKDDKAERERVTREKAFVAFCRKTWGAADLDTLIGEATDANDAAEHLSLTENTSPPTLDSPSSDPLLSRSRALSSLLAKRKRT